MKVEDLLDEIKLKATTSGGKGGQNVNKVATRVELYFHIPTSVILTSEQKELLLLKLSTRVSDDGMLRLVSSSERSQLKNKEKVKEKFLELISKALEPVKKRKKTKPSPEVKEKRIRDKKLQSEKKSRRNRDF